MLQVITVISFKRKKWLFLQRVGGSETEELEAYVSASLVSVWMAGKLSSCDSATKEEEQATSAASDNSSAANANMC